MARGARIVLADYPHHLIHRGHNRQIVFTGEGDFRYYLDNLRRWKETLGCKVHAYCLMRNHVHLVVNPGRDGTRLGLLMKRVAGRQTRLVNWLNRRSGTLWEGRYKSSPLSTDGYLLACCRYVEMNPVRAGIVADPADYLWSSFRQRAGIGGEPWLDEDPCYQGFGSLPDLRAKRYREWFASTIPDGEWDVMRLGIQRERLTGDERSAKELSGRIGRHVGPRAPGRPRKNRSVPIFAGSSFRDTIPACRGAASSSRSSSSSSR